MTSTTGRVVWRFAALGGAPVVVIKDPERACRWYAKDMGSYVFRWECLGCGADQIDSWDDKFMAEDVAQFRANKHAQSHHCMSPTPDTDPVAELRDEVAGLRMDLAVAVGAFREFTAVFARMAEPLADGARALPDIAQAIADRPDHSKTLDDIATGVESLVSAIDDHQPRPRRWGRRRSTPEKEVTA